MPLHMQCQSLIESLRGVPAMLTAAVAVVGCAEDGDDVLVVAPVVALHHQLVGASHQVELVGVVELLRDVLAEGVACTPGRDTPATPVIRV